MNEEADATCHRLGLVVMSEITGEKQLFAAVKKCTNLYILFILGSFAPSKRCHRKLSHSLIAHAKMCPYNKIATVHFTDSQSSDVAFVSDTHDCPGSDSCSYLCSPCREEPSLSEETGFAAI